MQRPVSLLVCLAPKRLSEVAAPGGAGFGDLGALTLAGALREAGHAVRVVHGFALPETQLFGEGAAAQVGAPTSALLSAIGEPSADVVWVSAHPEVELEAQRELLIALAERGAERLWLLAGSLEENRLGRLTEGASPLVAGALLTAAGRASKPTAFRLPALTLPGLEVTYLDSAADVLGALASGAAPPAGSLPLPSAAGASGASPPPPPAWDRLDLGAYRRTQARCAEALRVARAGQGQPAFPPGSFLGAAALSLPVRVQGVGALSSLELPWASDVRLWVVDDTAALRAEQLTAFLADFEALAARWGRLPLSFELPHGLRASQVLEAHLPTLRGAHAGVRLVAEGRLTEAAFAELRRVSAAAQQAGVPLSCEIPIGVWGESRAEINRVLAQAMELWDEHRALPLVLTPQALGVSPPPGGEPIEPAVLEDFVWTVSRRLAASSGPEKVIMNLTYACNNRCTFCAVGTRTQFHGHTESQREHLREYRARGVKLVDFDGGEPTLHPDLIGTVRYARAIGYERINVTTNGRLAYYEPYAKKLVRSGLTTLLFSVHGPDARSHAQQVGVAEAFEQTTGGIRNCVKFAPPGVELGMNVTLTKSNTQKLEQLTQLCWDLGLRWINIQFLTPFGRATKMIAPETEEAARVTRGVIDRWRDRIKVQIINLPFCFMPGYEDHLEGDLLKLARHMIFVNNEDVNLADYLAERRVRKPVCEGCTRAVFCGGFYELDSVPEPPWLVSPDELVKKRSLATVG